MKKVIATEKIPIKMWLDDIEDGALAQAENLANLPFAFKHVAIMPDSHEGYGMPIGGVLATKGAVIPNAVGVDIGCGMCAVKTSRTSITTDDLKSIMGKIRERIPVGFDHHKEAQDNILMPQQEINGDMMIFHLYNAARKQLGTLGGGNHFIEIQKGSDGHIWIMIHSGSRNLGKQIADHYNKVAKKLHERWYTSVDPKHDLAFLPIETNEAKRYMREMQYCVDFALANRKLMIYRIQEIFHNHFDGDIVFDETINIAHNYVRWENHFGQNVLVHRKGATSASEGEIGIIPGSMGTASYIVKGLGNPESFKSCSHGAGRKMGRKAAVRDLDFEYETEQMDKLGIIHGMRSKQDLEEAPGAYKNIDEVMANQSDLVEILVSLKPLGVIKG